MVKSITAPTSGFNGSMNANRGHTYSYCCLELTLHQISSLSRAGEKGTALARVPKLNS